MSKSWITPRMRNWLGLCVVVIALDQLTKWIVLLNLAPGSGIAVSGFFQLVLVFNPGAAFSFLADQPGWQRWFFVILSLAISAWLLSMLRQHQHEKLMPLALSLIIGGALGNVVDRLIFGAVVDFLYFHIGRYGWPAFNLADSAISVGVALLIWAQLTRKEPLSSEEKTS